MTKEELEKATGQELIDERNYCGVDGYYGDYLDNVNAEMLKRFNRLAELEAQIEKLIDFVLSKTECCDVCPITDTCINSEGTCPYVGILAKGEEEVTREWLMQFISKEIKENDKEKVM